MTSTKRTPLPGAGWVRPWRQLVEIAWSAPVVIGYRTARAVTGGWPPSARDRREYRRMVQEKAAALGEAIHAAMTTPSQGKAAHMAAVLHPVHRRVAANRRRLGPARPASGTRR